MTQAKQQPTAYGDRSPASPDEVSAIYDEFDSFLVRSSTAGGTPVVHVEYEEGTTLCETAERQRRSDHLRRKTPEELPKEYLVEASMHICRYCMSVWRST